MAECRRIKKNIYLKKMQGCMKLASLNKKKITDEDILVVSRQYEISKTSLANGWRTFQESGGQYIDYRVKTGNGPKIKAVSRFTPCIIARDVTPEEAGSIIIEYMTTDINSRALSAKYNVALYQFYNWIRELNVSGTLLGKRVLEPKKYAKLIIKDVIWFKKNPNTTRQSIKNLTVTEKAAYQRVAEVLLNYLPVKKVNND